MPPILNAVTSNPVVPVWKSIAKSAFGRSSRLNSSPACRLGAVAPFSFPGHSRHEIRMLVRKFAGHHHGVHDGENAGASVVIALHGFVILEQPSDLRRALENCLRGIG